MTSPSGGDHPTTDNISDLLEGLLPPEDGRAVAAHLNSCARCLAVRDALVRTHTMLRDAGRATPPIPPPVFEQVESALREESRARAETTGVASLSAARERRSVGWKTKVLGAAAAVAVFGGGGAVIYQAMGPNSEPLAGSAPSQTAEPSGPGDTSAAPPPEGDSTVPESLPTDDFADGVRDLLDRQRPGFGDDTEWGIQQDPTANLDPSQSSCVQRILDEEGAQPILAAEERTYNGVHAILVVTQTSEDNTVHAYVIAGCADNEPEIRHDGLVDTN